MHILYVVNTCFRRYKKNGRTVSELDSGLDLIYVSPATWIPLSMKDECVEIPNDSPMRTKNSRAQNVLPWANSCEILSERSEGDVSAKPVPFHPVQVRIRRHVSEIFTGSILNGAIPRLSIWSVRLLAVRARSAPLPSTSYRTVKSLSCGFQESQPPYTDLEVRGTMFVTTGIPNEDVVVPIVTPSAKRSFGGLQTVQRSQNSFSGMLNNLPP